jgi:tetratricopeptide (TPR) repeat protein
MADNDEQWDAAQEGAELIADGELDAAISNLERLVRDEPENPYAYFYLGAAHYEKAENYAKALAAYVKSLELAPDYLGAMIGAGHALRMLGRHQEAIRMAQQILARVPNDPDAFFLIGACCFARGDDARAIEYLNKFLHTNPELEVATEVEGMLQVLRNKLEVN